ncbi:decaprenyl-phosphate phosphoribosyltransferase [Paraburkholderia caledonica]|uniref:decaprenyl-phosphate phosphoribosyltransferase n=1 Tax=Paraburkholderia caledonica TaxID=134536 RepID=UPI0038BA5212
MSVSISTIRSSALVRLVRPLQWIKNFFVFAPLLFSGKFRFGSSIQNACIAFIAFCFVSSAIYVFNDLNDVERDRRHPKKRFRPIASGQVSRFVAAVLIGALLVACFSVSVAANWKLLLVLGSYLVLNIGYTLQFKHQPVIDIFCIAAGFVLRVVAGAVALGVPLSSWMFVTTLCLALYLASLKRRQELLAMKSDSETRAVLKHYSIALVDRYAEMSAVGALLFYSLYVMNDGSRLVITIPIVLFGLFRYWFIVESKGEGESPTDALVRDPLLISTIVVWTAVCVYALSGLAA